ncbi:MAG: zinc dependent phospholipase C family protein [Chitinophagales bacterium]|nr:zinc dependent phospholipase C family protein [Chitinophagales bacterium]MDW8418018.1 zinc dependent phospholipase C family protein [Chitinophagales bacterium]
MRLISPYTLLLTFCLLWSTQQVCAWGFWAHKRINRIAVFLLPPEMISFYKQNIEYITEHAVDPDKRRYATPDEAPRHYIDLDHYCTYPCHDFPRRWDDAVKKYTEDTLKAYGIVPWRIHQMMYWLTDAFRMKDKNKILRLSAEIGHYIGDAHVPLHTTENYNGLLTGQAGIHAFWESRIPELFGEDYDYFIGHAEFIEKPLERIWKAVLESHRALDTVFGFEKILSASFPPDRKFAYEQRGMMTVRAQSEEYSKTYSDMMDGMVERRMRASIKMVADVWYTCWLNAGMPDLNKLHDIPLSPEEQQQVELEEKLWREKSRPMYGHPHPETGGE